MKKTRNMLMAVMLIGLLAGAAQAGLVGYWTFDGDNIDDLAGGDHNGTLVGGSYSTDVPTALGGGKSIDLSAGDHHAVINQFSGGASEQDFDFGGAMTVSAWIKGWPNGSWEPFVSKRGESGQGWQIRRRGGGPRTTFTLRGTSGDDDPEGRIDGNNPQWKHVVGVYDGTTRAWYVDGVMDGLVTDHNNISNTDSTVVFGARDNSGNSTTPPNASDPSGNVGNHSRIMIDDVAIYDVALSPNQAAYLAAGGDPTNLPAAAPLPMLTVGPPGGNGYFGIREVKGNGFLGTIGGAIGSLLSGGGTITDGTAAMVNHNDPNNAGGGGYFGNASKAPFLSDTGGDDNDSAFLARGGLVIDEAGTYTFGFRGDDGSMLRIEGANFTKKWGDGNHSTAFGDTMLYGRPTGDSNSGASTYLDTGVYPLEFLFFERGGGAYVELWAAKGDFSSFDANAFRLIGDVENGGLRLSEIPEPATMALLSLAACGLGGYVRRRRKA